MAERHVQHQATNKQVGIDVGLKAYYTDSDGAGNPHSLWKVEKRRQYLHRQVITQAEEKQESYQSLLKGFKAARRFCAQVRESIHATSTLGGNKERQAGWQNEEIPPERWESVNTC